MVIHHERTHDASSPGVKSARLDRRGVLRHAAGLTAVGTLTLAGLRPGRAGAQSATPAPGGESGYAPVNGLDLYYEIHGTGQPLILLHGGLGAVESFGLLTPTLAETRQVIAVDLQAHGRTADIDRPFSFESMADEIAALIAYLGLETADIFGFSLGGGVALQTAIRHPEVVRKLVIASTVFKRDGWHPEVLAGMSAMNADAAAAMTETPIYDAYVSVAPRPEDWPTLVTKLGQLLAQDYDWTESVRSIVAPTLLVFADADNVRLTHALELFELLGGDVPGDLVPVPASRFAVLPSTTHFGVLTRADLLLSIIPPFLDASS
jgi:pimeloyl-ACP methyl ester carboxylesterase